MTTKVATSARTRGSAGPSIPWAICSSSSITTCCALPTIASRSTPTSCWSSCNMPTASRDLPVLVVALAALTACAAAQDRTTDRKTPARQWEDFDAGRFDRSIQIDNAWMPLKPGTRFTYDGTSIEDDGKAVPHRIVVNVTDLTKLIGGVRTLVTWDLDYSNGELVEAELAFYAQDSSGTVWYLGEYPEEYEEGKVVAARLWPHG